jgi:hypothetical protein
MQGSSRRRPEALGPTAARDDRIRVLRAPKLVIALATTGWRRADRAERVLLDERDRRLQDDPRARNVANPIVRLAGRQATKANARAECWL